MVEVLNLNLIPSKYVYCSPLTYSSQLPELSLFDESSDVSLDGLLRCFAFGERFELTLDLFTGGNSRTNPCNN